MWNYNLFASKTSQAGTLYRHVGLMGFRSPLKQFFSDTAKSYEEAIPAVETCASSVHCQISKIDLKKPN